MAKKARKSADTILGLINSLPEGERNRLFELLARDPKNKPVSELLQWLLYVLRMFDKLWTSTDKLWGDSACATSVRRQLDEAHADERFRELRRRVDRLQPKRGMTEYNQETLRLYYELLKKHGTERGAKTKALKELLTLPGEQNKAYVRNYRESCRNHPQGKGEMEPVRAHVKRLVNTHRKSPL